MDNPKWYQKNPFIILFLVVFFPVGLYLMWKYSDWSPKTKWIVTGVLLFFVFIIGITDDASNDSSQSHTSENDQQSVSSYNWQTEQGTLLRRVEEVVVDQIGEKNNMGENTIISIQTERDGLWINYHASENFTSNMTRGGIKSDMVDVFSNLNNDILDEFYNVTIVAELPLVDPEGNKSVENVMTVSLTTEKIGEINWDNFLRENLEVVASVYNVHPAIQ
jgi:hypothetical protein